MGFIDYVNHGMEAYGAAKITYADTVITVSEYTVILALEVALIRGVARGGAHGARAPY